MAHRFTIGVEEEFQIIDPATGELRSHVTQLISQASADIAEQVKPELHQSIVETGTRICESVSDLRIATIVFGENSITPVPPNTFNARPDYRRDVIVVPGVIHEHGSAALVAGTPGR